VSNQEDKNLPDRHLVTAVLNGDRHAFGLIIKKTEGLIAQMTFKMISSPADRKDIAQDIYVKAFKNLRGFKFQSKLSTWIGQIAYNTCLNYLEKKKLVLIDNFAEDGEISEYNFNQEVGNDTEETLFNKELAKILHTEIEQLKPLYKTLISLYHQEELSYAEIAEITALPEGTVKNYIFRARKTLKENILLKHKRNDL